MEKNRAGLENFYNASNKTSLFLMLEISTFMISELLVIIFINNMFSLLIKISMNISFLDHIKYIIHINY